MGAVMDGGFRAGTGWSPVQTGAVGGSDRETCLPLDAGHRYQVRRHRIEPGGALPWCHHLHRTEHWTVVQGTARVIRDGVPALVSEGQSFTVALGQSHALENPGRIPLVLIEVWTGTYLGEDDLVAEGPAAVPT